MVLGRAQERVVQTLTFHLHPRFRTTSNLDHTTSSPSNLKLQVDVGRVKLIRLRLCIYSRLPHHLLNLCLVLSHLLHRVQHNRQRLRSRRSRSHNMRSIPLVGAGVEPVGQD